MKMIKILLSITLTTVLSMAQDNKDQDIDGVPDNIDQCIDTPFLDEVDETGCSVSSHLDFSFGYGFSTNEDLVDRETQHAAKFQIVYYLNNWSYALRTGYFLVDDGEMQDTIVKIKRKFKLNKALNISFGAGIKLPTYKIKGNRVDYTLYSSIVSYPLSSLSVFAGANHTFVNDKEITVPIQDTNTAYIGTGYFFTKDLYANLTYSYAQSKFATNHAAKSFSSTIFYKIDEKWFTTLSYGHQIDDDDLHNSLNLKFGYSLW